MLRDQRGEIRNGSVRSRLIQHNDKWRATGSEWAHCQSQWKSGLWRWQQKQNITRIKKDQTTEVHNKTRVGAYKLYLARSGWDWSEKVSSYFTRGCDYFSVLFPWLKEKLAKKVGWHDALQWCHCVCPIAGLGSIDSHGQTSLVATVPMVSPPDQHQ